MEQETMIEQKLKWDRHDMILIKECEEEGMSAVTFFMWKDPEYHESILAPWEAL